MDDLFSQVSCLRRDGSLQVLVFLFALNGFDADGREAEFAEIVGAGSHIDFACVGGEIEAIDDEFAGNPRGQFVGPFVEVHVGVDAAGLFEIEAGVEGRVTGIEGGGGFSKEAEGVEVGAI